MNSYIDDVVSPRNIIHMFNPCAVKAKSMSRSIRQVCEFRILSKTTFSFIAFKNDNNNHSRIQRYLGTFSIVPKNILNCCLRSLQ